MAKKKKKAETEIENEYFQVLLDRLGIEEYDLILIGDGSGSKWGLPIGWAVTAIAKTSMERKVFYGAMNDGTVNIAEAMAYMQPLLWYATKVRAERKQGGVTREHIVHIITDSEYVREVGSRGHVDFSTNQPIWAVYELLKRQCLQINWHWQRRDEVALNAFADLLSKRSRKLFKENDQENALRLRGITRDDANPWE